MGLRVILANEGVAEIIEPVIASPKGKAISSIWLLEEIASAFGLAMTGYSTSATPSNTRIYCPLFFAMDFRFRDSAIIDVIMSFLRKGCVIIAIMSFFSQPPGTKCDICDLKGVKSSQFWIDHHFWIYNQLILLNINYL